MSAADAEKKQKDYLFTNQLKTTVYSKPKGEDGRKVVARLFFGEWSKRLDESGGELKIRFRGGEGYAKEGDFGDGRTLEVYFIDVGQGDAVLIQTPDDKRILIDGGKNEAAHSYLKWKYHLKKYEKVFDAVILTHGDEDHSKGLISILNDEKVLVKSVYHNGIALRKGGGLGVLTPDGKYLAELYDDVEELRPAYDGLSDLTKKWVDAVSGARRRVEEYNGRPEGERLEKIDFTCQRADQNTGRVAIGEAGVEVSFLGPVNHGTMDDPRLKKFSSESGKTINGNSVAVMVTYGKAKIFLCGDMNAMSEDAFLERHPGEGLRANVFKASHHGSDDFTTGFLDAVKPWVSVVSSGDYPDYGHPRAVLLGSLGKYAPGEVARPLLFSTEVAATFKPISAEQIAGLDAGTGKPVAHLYEKTVHGLINVRTDGRWLAAGRVYGKEKGEGGRSVWEWEAYALDLESGELREKIPR